MFHSGVSRANVPRISERTWIMRDQMIKACVTITALGLMTLAGCSKSSPPKTMKIGANISLAEHSAEFKKEVIKVTDGVYVAVGFGLANSILLEGDNGVVIVDTMESAEAAADVKEAFDLITNKPVKAIIYTHNHADHVFGTKVMAGGHNPDVYSHERTRYYLDRVVNVIRPTIFRRSMRQFGSLLPEGGVINAGIGPRLRLDKSSTIALVFPTKTFSGDRLDLEIAGLKLQLFHAPGETNDQIFIWLPEKKVLLPADNYYKAFPNLYAIRGTPYRDVTEWVRSLDKIRAFQPEYLVPGHTRPLKGAAKIYAALTNYRDAIQFVHDQTIRCMNLGLTPDETVEQVKLPQHLARLPYLREYYGTVEWSVRAIYNGYLGWFDGNPTNLFPLPLRERAKRFADLAGGPEALLARAREAAADNDHQWALELTDQLLILNPDLKAVLDLRASALSSLGQKQINANARSYYLTHALETQKKLAIGTRKVTNKDLVHKIPLKAIFKSMAVKLNPIKSSDTNTTVGFRFPDTKEEFTVHVRRGVAEIQPTFPKNPHVSVTVDSRVWKEIVAGIRSPVVSYAKDEVRIDGGSLNLMSFLKLFKTD
jgi:alkyl sulfatase BDS1-like metallo-beta-lactamase superfamily hydrolase